MIKDLLKRTFIYDIVIAFRRMVMICSYHINPKRYISNCYKKKMRGKKVDWKNPTDLNEKIQWLKLYSDTSKWTKLADKLLVREYIENCGLKNILVPLFGVFTNAKDIDFDKLPESFVLKTNHGSGDTMIINDKTLINKEEIIKTLNNNLKHKFGYECGEPHYFPIKPVIIAERLLINDDSKISSSIIDYKFWCFNGKARYVFVCSNRTKYNTDIMVYDTRWAPYPEYCKNTSHYKIGTPIPKPGNLETMIQISERLSSDFPEVRVDLYSSERRIYFGELTFTSMGGFMNYFSQEFLNILGEYTNI